MRPIYLDYQSTTPVDPRVLEAMTPFFLEHYGNASSQTHAYGWEADLAVCEARKLIANAISTTDPTTLIFTSGATESNNLAIKGVINACQKKPAHIITQVTEHKCVLESCKGLEKEGHQVTYLPVDQEGFVDPQAVKKTIKKNTVLCSIMMANNEIGTIQPIQEISKICHEKNVFLHTDAVQTVGKIPLHVRELGIDLMSLSAHKIYGPKGIGALFVKRDPLLRLTPLLGGAGHERGLRSGTLNVPAIVGFAKALKLCLQEMEAESKRLTELRDTFISQITKQVEGVHLNGPPQKRLPGNINVSIDYVKSDDLILAAPQIAISSGSACSSGSPEPSYVIKALTHNENRVNSSIRIGLGRQTTKEHIDIALDAILKAVKKIRAKSLEYEMVKNT